MKAQGPPRDVPPERLFRVLLGRPRPVWPISLRFDYAPELALSVRALTATEDEGARDLDLELPEDVRRAQWVTRTVAASLLVDGAPAFSSPEEVEGFSDAEIVAMASSVLDALAVVSPSYSRSDTVAWASYLQRGATHPTNTSLFMAIGAGAFEQGIRGSWFRFAWTDFFGMPAIDLTDGQRMAYEAARKVFKDKIK